MKVKELTSDAFWKGEICAHGLVEDERETYRAKVYLKSSQVFDYSCSCEEGNSYKGMCPHCKALLEEYRKVESESLRPPVSTSEAVRTMIQEYTKREVAEIMGEGETKKVRLVPSLVLTSKGVGLECRLGRERLYLLKDLTDFARALKEGRQEEYGKPGKGLSFQHTVQAFDEPSRPLVRFIMDLVDSYRLHYEQLKTRVTAVLPASRTLYLDRAGCDRLFSICRGRVLEATAPNGQVRRLALCEENPSFEVEVKKEGNDGLRVTIPGELLTFSGERCLYVADQNRLYRCDEDFSKTLSVFLRQMTESRISRGEVLVNDRDVPLFYERVLKKLGQYGLLKEVGVDLAAYQPETLQAVFVFDSEGPDQVSMKPELSYGEVKFHPLEAGSLPHSVCRDVPGEYRVSQLILNYFEYREDGTQNLIIRNDPDALYRLLDEGMEQFKAVGDVYLSESFRKLRVLPAPSVSVGVSLLGGWLELSVDTGEMSGAEFARVLSEYTQKKKYYRMKSGEFLKLSEDGLLTVSKLAEGLSVTKEELKGKNLKLPGYRALYLDSLMKEDSRVIFHRDQAFRSLVRNMKSVEDSRFEVPKEVKGVLREYQKTGYRWLKTLDEYGFGGILADDMGLGKTLQVISVLLDYYNGKRETKSLVSQGTSGGDASIGRQPSLVVCPASLVYNWCHEFETFAPALRVKALVGSSEERMQLLGQLEETDIVITSYDLLKRDLAGYLNLNFRYEVIDEAQYIKNAATQSARAVKSVHARTRFALTGTPVENHLGELWSIFDYLMPGFLFSYRKFKTMFELPIVKEEDRRALESLHRMIGPFVLRRLKSDVLKELPEKLEKIVYSALEGKQKALYNGNALKLKEMLQADSEAGGGKARFQVLAELTRLRELCCDPSLCYGNYDGGSAKLETCMDLISGAVEAGHKILLFSQFSSMLEIIRKRLQKDKITCHMLTGATPKEERNRLVQAFHKDEVPIFLISLKAGGTGLNLTAADIVIHYDPWWNVAAQNQATDRAHRIGQDKQVTVFKLIMKQTIEENILKLQESKQHLAEQVVTEGMVSLAGLSRKELLEILGNG